MTFNLSVPDLMSAERLLLRAGYHAHNDPRTGEHSLAKRLFAAGHFPKYHAYLEVRSGGLVVNLHLDQKQPSYSGGHMHSGEYEGPLLERERDRILKALSLPGASATRN